MYYDFIKLKKKVKLIYDVKNKYSDLFEGFVNGVQIKRSLWVFGNVLFFESGDECMGVFF